MAQHISACFPQVAPTILNILGLDPSALQAVGIEGTTVLPGLSAPTA